MIETLKTEEDIVKALKTDKDMIEALKTDKDIVEAINMEDDIVKAKTTEEDIVKVLKTDEEKVDMIGSLQTEGEDDITKTKGDIETGLGEEEEEDHINRGFNLQVTQCSGL